MLPIGYRSTAGGNWGSRNHVAVIAFRRLQASLAPLSEQLASFSEYLTGRLETLSGHCWLGIGLCLVAVQKSKNFGLPESETKPAKEPCMICSVLRCWKSHFR